MSGKMQSYWSGQKWEVVRKLGIVNANGHPKYHGLTPAEETVIEQAIDALKQRLDLRDFLGKPIKVGCRVVVSRGRQGLDVGTVTDIDVSKGILVERPPGPTGYVMKGRFGMPSEMVVLN